MDKFRKIITFTASLLKRKNMKRIAFLLVAGCGWLAAGAASGESALVVGPDFSVREDSHAAAEKNGQVYT
ncbi:MAG: hypothetical protein K2G93_08470, partial [Rikenella sp.]|nr:hypothetical protein [Rikenella sp.]